MVTRFFLVCARSPLQLRRFRELFGSEGPEAQTVIEQPCTLLFHWKDGVGPQEEELMNMASHLGSELCIFGIDPLVLAAHSSFNLASHDPGVIWSLDLWRETIQAFLGPQYPPISTRLVDHILDRINQVGLASIHPIERKVLDRYAQQA